MRDFKLFIDMDNTCVNFDKHVIDIMNKEKGMNYNWEDNTCWWWSDTGVEKEYFEELITRQGTFLNCEPIDGAVEYINKLYNEGFEIVFLTLPQWDNPYCVTEKIEWLKNHFEWFNVDKHLVFTKQKHLLYRPLRLLIDDSIDYLDSWDGVKICKGNKINKDYRGFREETWKDIYKLIKEFEDGR